MTRLQKKCLVASSGAHGLLLLTLLVAAVFHSESAVTEEQVLTLISPRILDRDGSGGEAPAVVTPQPVAPPSHPAQEEPVPQSRAATQPPKTVTVSVPKPRADRPSLEKPAISTKPVPKSHEVNVDLSRTTHGPAPAKPSEPATTPTHSSADTRSEEVEKVFGDLGSEIRRSAATATVVTLPGEGGGEAFTGYNEVIRSVYHRAWKAPDDTPGRLPTVDVKIVVARDGSVISAELTSPSGNATVDRSVQRALDAVSKLPPFPEGSQDVQRTFNIRFNLEAMQSSG